MNLMSCLADGGVLAPVGNQPLPILATSFSRGKQSEASGFPSNSGAFE
jgi:hypothetical protein